jgi:magnesium chelatase family protein
LHFSILKSGVLSGLRFQPIQIEVDVSTGLFSFTIVGLPDKTVEESRERIIAALKNSGFDSPKTKNQKIVVSLAPAHTRKEGSSLDLPITLSYLKAVGTIQTSIDDILCIGELSLTGEVKSCKGILPFLKFAIDQKFKKVFIPFDHKEEAELIQGIEIFLVKNLKQLVDHIQGTDHIHPLVYRDVTDESIDEPSENIKIIGQEIAKRALIIAAAGGHSLILCGPPGTGKTLLAKSIQPLLPKLSIDECIETTSIYSLIQNTVQPIRLSPFRSPHHRTTTTSLIGGGVPVRPGELTLAHNGILFLDELAEFDREALESLREPLEEHTVRISRGKYTHDFPANFILIAAFNPCPCGYRESHIEKCTCSAHKIQQYQKKLSGPFIDRIDLWVNVERDIEIYKKDSLLKSQDTHELLETKKIILKARSTQKTRYKHNKTLQLNSSALPSHCESLFNLDPEAERVLKQAAQNMNMSLRSFHKVLKVARTIADIEQTKNVRVAHILEALSFRPRRD